jgi:hypothetical protein
MYGIGRSGWTFRPQKSGTVLIMMSFDIVGAGANYAWFQQGFGSGGAPANGQTWAGAGANGLGGGHGPSYQGGSCSLQGIATGLAIGTLYWFDLAATSQSGTISQQVANVAGTVVEL